MTNFFKRLNVVVDIFSGLEFGFRFIPGNELVAESEGEVTNAEFGVLLSFLFVNILLVLEKAEQE